MKRKFVYLYLLGLLLFSVACTGNFRDYNTDLSGITDDDLIIDDNGYGIRLGIIQQGVYFNYDYGKGKNWPFQLIQNLNADMFSGYMHDGKPLNGGSHNSDYNMQDGWNSAMWTHMYSYIFTDISVGECYPKYTSCSVRDNENIKGGSDASCDGLLWSYHL